MKRLESRNTHHASMMMVMAEPTEAAAACGGAASASAALEASSFALTESAFFLAPSVSSAFPAVESLAFLDGALAGATTGVSARFTAVALLVFLGVMAGGGAEIFAFLFGGITFVHARALPLYGSSSVDQSYLKHLERATRHGYFFSRHCLVTAGDNKSRSPALSICRIQPKEMRGSSHRVCVARSSTEVTPVVGGPRSYKRFRTRSRILHHS
ncbi:hypothetical protein BHE74_00022943 [Ensete ventricosum]|nr:hypothetical protein GW17_00048549 [Ensete ventricosum]RWW69454.1 hypothetical protein BHE74_00022943 [Ensete ventricosum]RZS09451.1 hypothetical protein BHM03_00040531 [Ensete ventricosum]